MFRCKCGNFPLKEMSSSLYVGFHEHKYGECCDIWKLRTEKYEEIAKRQQLELDIFRNQQSSAIHIIGEENDYAAPV